MAELAIELQEVGVSFPMRRGLRAPRFPALKRVSLRLEHGQRLAVVGRNGAGKSTLLQVLADVLAPDRGRIVRNHGVCQLLNLNLGFLQHMTGRENAIMSGLLQGFDRATIDARLESIKAFSELGEFFEQPFRTYSSGMRARLGFSTALELQPDILLIDEILGVGDAQFQEKSRAALKDRIAAGVTVVIVSHSDDMLLRLCDTAVWIEQGETRCQGAVQQVLDAYHHYVSGDTV